MACHHREVLKETDEVVEVIHCTMAERLNSQIPLGPPLQKGEVFE
jgi:hypothetical protein